LKENWEKAINFVLKWEGGYSNDPKDPGGLTIYGITYKYHPKEVAEMEKLWKQGKFDECKAIAKKIYKEKYWNAIKGDSLPYPLDIIVFDTAVNMGVSTALNLLSKSQSKWEVYLLERIRRYCDIAKNNQRFFYGWIRRVIDLYQTVSKQ